MAHKMEELQAKFAKQVAFIDKMRANVIINSENFEILKNYTYSLNDKIAVLEKAFETKECEHDKAIAEIIEEARKEKDELNNFWLEKFQDLEKRTEREKNNLKAHIVKKESEDETLLQQEKIKIHDLLKANKRKIEEVENKMEKQKKSINIIKNVNICEECGEVFNSKSELKTHIRSSHPKHINCNQCDLSFSESWMLENHMGTHNLIKDHRCDVCGKGFYFKWRFMQHVKTHSCQNVKTCHYFNNRKDCPFEEVGCKFKHVNSPECNNKSNCSRKLCPFQHK